MNFPITEAILSSQYKFEQEDIYKILDQILKLISKGEYVEGELVCSIYHKCIKVTENTIENESDPFFSHSLKQVLEILHWHTRLISERKSMVTNLISNQNSNPYKNVYENLEDDQATNSDFGSFGIKYAAIEEDQIEYSCQYNKNDIEEEEQNDLLISLLKQPNNKNGFEDVAGLIEAKRLLNQTIILPAQYPHLFKGARRPWKRVLLYGLPGTGKTHLANAVAAQAGIPFYCVSSADLLSSWVGESEKLVREVFKKTSQLPGSSIIFIDEIDGLCRKRNSQEDDHSRRMKTELLNQIDGNSQDDCPNNVIFLGATNCPWDLDTAFIRRFQRRIHIPLPNRDARKEIIKLHSTDGKDLTCTSFTESEWNQLLDATEGYSGSDLANLSISALLEPIRDIEEANFWARTSNGQMVPCIENHPRAISCKLQDIDAEKVGTRKVTLTDFMKSLTTTPRTNTDDEITKFAEFTKKFGMNG